MSAARPPEGAQLPLGGTARSAKGAPSSAAAPDAVDARTISWQDHLALTQLYAAYAAALSAGEWDAWPGFFTEDCSYKLQPRENFDRGFPLCTLLFESKGMLKDRVYGIRETLFHDPYYQRIVTGQPLVLRADDEVGIHCEVNYAVFRTKPSQPSTVFNVGRAIDRIVRTPDGLKFASRLLVFDSELVPNSIIYPF